MKYCEISMMTFVFRSLGIISLSLMLSGCRLTDVLHKHHDGQPAFRGVVQTSGQFAHARSLPISATGLSLGEAVKQSLRSGIQPGTALPVSTATRQPPLGSQRVKSAKDTLTGLKSLKKDLSKLSDDSNNFFIGKLEKTASHLVTDEMVGAENEVFVQNQIRALMLFRQEVFTEDADESELEELANEIDKLIQHRGITSLQTETETAANVIERSARREALRELGDQIAEQLKSLDSVEAPEEEASEDTDSSTDDTQSENSPKPQTSPNTASNLYYDAAVILTKATGRRVIAPLWLVQMFAAGDIALENGDRIEVTHYERTAFAEYQKLEDTVVLVGGLVSRPRIQRNVRRLSQVMGTSQLDQRLVNFADLVVLQRINSNDQLEEYLIPRGASGIYGSSSEFDRWFQEAQLKTGDIVRVGSLDFHPLIRDGRTIAQAASAEQIYEEFGSPEERSRNKTIDQIPILGGIHGLVEQTTGLSADTVSQGSRRVHEAASLVPASVGLPSLATQR